MIASNSVILAERPALAQSPVVHGLGHTYAHHCVLEYMERIAILNLRRVFQLAAEKEISDAQPLKGRPNFLNSRHRYSDALMRTRGIRKPGFTES
jgi:hypothetical protein